MSRLSSGRNVYHAVAFRQRDPRSSRGTTRYGNEHCATPAQCQQPSKDDENNEERVLREYEVGEQSINHVWSV